MQSNTIRPHPQFQDILKPKKPVEDTERISFLNLRRWPAIFYDYQAAWLLNCHEDDIPALIEAGLLVPLGGATQDDAKRFAREMLLRIAADESILGAISDVIYRRRICGRNA